MDSNLTDLGYVEETVFGTTPASALQILRRTGGSLRPTMGSIRSGEIRSDLRAGPPIRTSQAGGGQVNVEWSYGTFDDLLEGMLLESWSSNVLVDGTTKKSFTFEEQFTDPDISPSQYLIFKGSRLASLSMGLALDSIVTGSFSIMAATPSIAQASAGTGAAAAPTTTEPFNCVDHITVLREGSADLGHTVGVDIRLDRALRNKRELGSLNPWEIGVGRLLVSGTIQQYFEDDTLLDAWFAHDERSLEVTLTDDAGNDLLIHVPRLKYEGEPEITNPGPDSDRILRVNWVGFADADDAALISFTRTPA